MFGCLILIVHLSIYLLFPIFYTNSLQDQLVEDSKMIQEVLSGSTQREGKTFLSAYAKKNDLDILAQIQDEMISYQEGQITIQYFLDDEDVVKIQENSSVETILSVQKKGVFQDGGNFKFQVMKSLSPVQDATEITLSLLPFTITVSLILSLVFSYLYSKKVTRPVLDMISSTKQMKVEFLRAASHDLKTPLASLRILLENMLYKIGKYQDHDYYLNEAIKQVDQLTGMIKEILDASKIQDVPNNPTKLNLESMIQEILVLQQKQIEKKGIQLQVEWTGIEHIFVNKDLFRMICTNIIDNAIKYCDEKGTVSIISQDHRLFVRNSCVPLSKETSEQVFEAFYRDVQGKEKYPVGNGLGLYIVKEALVAMDVSFHFYPEAEGMCFMMDLSSLTKG